MSFDRNQDAEDVASPADRPVQAAPGLDHDRETANRTEATPGSEVRDRALGELVSENADLYRRNAEQDRAIKQLQARLDRSEARFRAWADDVALRSEAQAKREEALTDRITELERRLADTPGTGDPRGSERRLSEPVSARAESGQNEHKRTRLSNEFIGIGAAASVEVVTAIADPTAPSLIIGALGMVATGIPWIRKLREASHGDRTTD